MRRRDYLRALGLAAGAGVAGCTTPFAGESGDADSRTSSSATTTPTSTPSESATTERPTTESASPTTRRATPGQSVSLPVAKSDLVRKTGRDAIPAIVDPAFGPNWEDVSYRLDPEDEESDYDPELASDDTVLGVARDGAARAYPLKLLNWHEVVNDAFGGPLLVSYCPVCRSGVVASRRIDERTLTFGVSGYLLRANLVLYDEETETLWSQLLAKGINGPLTGTDLPLEPSTLTSWGAWRDEYSDAEVLLPPPESSTVVGETRINYGIDLYARRQDIQEEYPDYGVLGDLEWTDTRLKRRTVVVGVEANGQATAYPVREIRFDDPVNDRVGGRPVLVTLADGETPVAYDRRVDGQTLTFEKDDGRLLAGGSTWSPLTGRALSGPYEGQRLRSATDTGAVYWAAWLQFHPDSTVYGR
jgi:hypothetical protein